MSKRAGSLAIVCSVLIWAVAPVWASQGNEEPEQALPQACFDTANTSAECQTLYRYAELLGFGNIPDYVGFVQSLLVEFRGEAPFLPLMENPEVKAFRERMENGEQPTEAMTQELEQFMSHWLGEIAEFRHAQDWVSLQFQDIFFNRLIHLNAQLFPQLDDVAAIERTFLHADPRLPDVLSELSPLAQGQEILVEGEAPPTVLDWLTSAYGLSDASATQDLLLAMINQHRYGGRPYDFPLFDQRPEIGALLNMPVDTPIEMTEALQNDIAWLEDIRVRDSDNLLRSIHSYEAYAVNNLLALLTFAEGLSDPQPRIPSARSTSLIDLHVYVDADVYAQIEQVRGSYMSLDADVVATILALRMGAQLPAIGSTFVRLEDIENGQYVVIQLTPFMGHIVYQYTSGYEKKDLADEAD